jgi:hypothetical protein
LWLPPSIPEAIPLRNIKAKTIIKTLTILLQQVRHAFIIKQFKSNAYHPESQGALERLHNILEKYESILFIQSKWLRWWGPHATVCYESQRFGPFELVFGHSVRGPLNILKEKWPFENTVISIVDYVWVF